VLLIVEIGHAPTPTEPHDLDESVLALFAPDFRVERQQRFGLREDHNVYASILEGRPYVERRRFVVRSTAMPRSCSRARFLRRRMAHPIGRPSRNHGEPSPWYTTAEERR